jgi:lipoic acid synthetase
MLIKKPEWFKVPLANYKGLQVQRLLRDLELNTVCQRAKCPNIGDCFNHGTATFLILGDICTRHCQFCAIASGNPLPPDSEEPLRMARAVQLMRLKHCVVTGVNRDDLPYSGAEFYAETIRQIKSLNPETTVEVLPGDFSGSQEALKILLQAKPVIYNHNLETVESLTPSIRDRRADYRISLKMLQQAKINLPGILTKSGLLVGLGEKWEEICATMRDLQEIACDGITIGQYIAPSSKHYPVQKYYTLEEFKSLELEAKKLGFRGVAIAPLVRSSYQAGILFKNRINLS